MSDICSAHAHTQIHNKHYYNVVLLHTYIQILMSVQQGRKFVTIYVKTLKEVTFAHVKEDMSYRMMAYTAKV